MRYEMLFYCTIKADMSQLNLPHGKSTAKKWKTGKLKSKKNGYAQKYR